MKNSDSMMGNMEKRVQLSECYLVTLVELLILYFFTSLKERKTQQKLIKKRQSSKVSSPRLSDSVNIDEDD